MHRFDLTEIVALVAGTIGANGGSVLMWGA